MVDQSDLQDPVLVIRIGPITAEFLIEGQIVPLYADDNDTRAAKNEASRYVEATAGATFAIRCIVDDTYNLESGIDQYPSRHEFREQICHHTSCTKRN